MKPLDPAYPWKALDAAVTSVWKGPGQLADVRAEKVDLVYRWGDRQQVCVRVADQTGRGAGLSRSDSVELSLNGSRKLPVRVHDRHPLELVGPVVEVGSSQDAQAVRFHLVNFMDLQRTPSHYLSGLAGVPEDVEMSGGGWTLRLVHRPSPAPSVNQRLWTVTHIGEIRRQDGATMPLEEIDDALDCVHRMFSVARSAWTPPALPVAYDATGEVTWRQAGSMLATSGTSHWTWLPTVRLDSLVEFCQGWMDVWTTPFWRPILLRLAGFLVEASKQPAADASFLETRLVLACSGLELFAWAIGEREGVDWRPGGPGAAAANLRAVLAWLGCTVEVPNELAALEALRKEKGMSDGPEIVTYVRNAAVHPRERDNQLSPTSEVSLQAWQLATWYLDLCVLRQVGFTGEYGCRLDLGRWENVVRQVPWGTGDNASH